MIEGDQIWMKNIQISSTVDKIEIAFTGVNKCSDCEDDGAVKFEFQNLKPDNVSCFVTKLQSKLKKKLFIIR